MALDLYAWAGQKFFQPVFEEFIFRNCWRADWNREVDVAAFRTINLPATPVINEAYAFEVKSSDEPEARQYGMKQLIIAAEHFTNKLDYDRCYGYLVTPTSIDEIVAIQTDGQHDAPMIYDKVRNDVIVDLNERVRTRDAGPILGAW